MPNMSRMAINADKNERVPRMLVVDDEPANSRVLVRLLEMFHYQIDCASDGLQAVRMWEDGEYDLVLMDINMPQLDGFGAASIIREKEKKRGGHTPIIAVTANSFRSIEDSYRSAGMDAYIAKPIDLRQVTEVLCKLIETLGGSEPHI